MAGSNPRKPGTSKASPRGQRGGNAKEEERKKAQELATRTGVPLWGAFRVVRGEITLNELLQSMLRREKFRRLQDRDGLDPDLAGHVASGSLPKWRARVLQDMRTAGRAKFTRDRIAIAHREKVPLAIWRFGSEDWDVGSVVKARTYDFNFAADGVEPEQIYKHDVKMVGAPEDLDSLRAARKFEKAVLKEGLGPSRDRKDRYRPTDEELCAVRDSGKAIKWIFRDGTAVKGTVQAFGRWDLDFETEDGATATLFFHALHASTATAISRLAR